MLSGLATEKDTVSEKKTLLSIAKIALFASDKEVDERDEKLDCKFAMPQAIFLYLFL